MTNEEKMQEALRDAVEFIEAHSNRWDGATGKHPFVIVSNAREALAAEGEYELCLGCMGGSVHHTCGKEPNADPPTVSDAEVDREALRDLRFIEQHAKFSVDVLNKAVEAINRVREALAAEDELCPHCDGLGGISEDNLCPVCKGAGTTDSPDVSDAEVDEALPDCMMPDGADPCEGYKALRRRYLQQPRERVPEAVKHERDCYRAVLEGQEFPLLDDLPSQGVDFCRVLGQEAAKRTKAIIESGRGEG